MKVLKFQLKTFCKKRLALNRFDKIKAVKALKDLSNLYKSSDATEDAAINLSMLFHTELFKELSIYNCFKYNNRVKCKKRKRPRKNDFSFRNKIRFTKYS